MSGFSRFVRQPLVHFLLIGAAIFALYAVVPQEEAEEVVSAPFDPGSEIRFTPQILERIDTEFRAVWQRDPTEDERAALIDNYVREEILVREALKLGLNRDDTVIRRRLVQKMDFLTSSAARAIAPDEEELKAFYEDTREIYMRPGRVAFEQIYLGEKLNDANVAKLQSQLQEGESPGNLGERSMLPSGLKLAVSQKVDGIFGKGFFEQLLALPEEGWQGPVKSGFGYHLVRVGERQDPSEREWDTIREHVADNFVLQKAEELKKKQFETLKAQYEIVLPETAQ
ncbi:MAG: peptidylprolyl isomerase [Roseibium sp.]